MVVCDITGAHDDINTTKQARGMIFLIIYLRTSLPKAATGCFSAKPKYTPTKPSKDYLTSLICKNKHRLKSTAEKTDQKTK